MSRRSTDVLAEAMAKGITPVEYMLGVLRDPKADSASRAWAAEKAAPYLHPRPAPTERTVEIDLPDTSTLEGVSAALDRVIAAVGEGRISPAEGQSVIGVIEAKRRTIETVDLLERIKKLEAARPVGR